MPDPTETLQTPQTESQPQTKNNEVFVSGPDVRVRGDQAAEHALENTFPATLFSEDKAVKQGAFSGFLGGVGAMVGDTPFGKGFRKSLIDSTFDTAGNLIFEYGSAVDESEPISDNLASPKGVIKIAKYGAASIFETGAKIPGEIARKTNLDARIQKLGLDIRNNASKFIKDNNLQPEQYSDTGDKFSYDLGSGSASIALSLGLGYLTGHPHVSSLYFGMIQKAQMFKEASTSARIKDLSTGEEKQVDFTDYRAAFNPDLSGGYAEGDRSNDGRYQLIKAPLSVREASAYSTLSAIPEASLEFVGLNMIMKGLRGYKPLIRTFLVAAEQALQEGLQQGAEEAIAKIGWDRPGTKTDIAKRIGYSALLGFLLGVPTGSLSTFALTKGVRGEMIQNGMSEEEADKLLEKWSERVIELGADDAEILVRGLLGDSVKFQEKASPFYSAVEKRLEERMPESARPDQVLGILREGVKQEEVDAVGLSEFLAGKDKVSKQDLLDYVRQNQVQIKEVRKGGTIKPGTLSLKESSDGEGYSAIDPDGREVNFIEKIEGNGKFRLSDDLGRSVYETAEEALQQAQYIYENQNPERPATKFGGRDLNLPGGENYREVLLTLPIGNELKDKAKNARMDKIERQLNDPESGLSEEDAFSLRREYQKLADELRSNGNFKSSHWDEPNVLAHFRLNDRQTDLGKTLFIEEIQSDWHQQGRKKGYIPKNRAQLDARRAELETMGLEAKQSGREFPSELKQEWADIMNKLQPNLEGVRAPDAPFKKTWHELALKRILRMAAEEGYDAIAWTTGEQQAERYDLSKAVDSIRWTSSDVRAYVELKGVKGISGQDLELGVNKQTGIIDVTDIGAPKEWEGKNISDILGKEISEKIKTQNDGTLTGEGLKVGGEGMKGFYDQMIPSFLNKYTKKWGGRVQDITMTATQEADIMNGEEAGTDTTQVHALEITPQMRESVLQGQPLFQRGSQSESIAKEEALSQWKKLKDLIPPHYQAVFADLIKSDFHAFSDIVNRLIVLTKDLKKTTIPHEAFHAIYNDVLSPQERQSLRDEVFLTKGFTDPLEAEEWLAERFGEHWVNRDERLNSVGGRIAQFVKDTKTFLKNFILSEDHIQQMFNDIAKGAYERNLAASSGDPGKDRVKFQDKQQDEPTPDYSDEINQIGEEVGSLSGEDKRYIEARFELDRLENNIQAVKDFRDRVGKIRKYENNYLKEELARIPKRYITKDKSARTIDEVMDELGYDNMTQLIDDMEKYEAMHKRALAKISDLYDTVDYYERLEKSLSKLVKKEVEKKLPPTGRGGIMPPELDFVSWKDVSGFRLMRETLDRNIESVVDKQQQPVVKEFLSEPIKKNETNRAEMLSDLRSFIRGQIDRLGIKNGSAEDKLVMKFGEGEMSEEQLKDASPEKFEQIKELAQTFRNLYDHLLDQINDVREAFGYEPIQKRKNYFRHFMDMGYIIEESGVLLRLADLPQEFQDFFKAQELPTTIAGKTYQFKPGKPFTNTELKRKGNKTVESAIGGFDNYLDAVSKQIFHTDSVQRVRVMDKYIRNFYSDGDRRLSAFVRYLDEYANLLAGKQTAWDRGVETYGARWVYNALDWLRQKTSGAIIAGNISAALTNTIPFTQHLASTDKDSVLKGLYEAFTTPFQRGQSFMVDGQKSDLFARRYPLDRIQHFGFQNVEAALGTLFNWVDMFTGKAVISGKYYEGLKLGLDKEVAMKRADDYAGRLLADRSWGQLPIIFKVKSLGAITQFQIEANSVISNLMHDIPREYEKEAGKMVSVLLQMMLYKYLYNNLFQAIAGRRPDLDPVQALLTALGWSREGKDRPLPARAWRAFEDLAGNLPGMNFIFGGGRLPVTDVFPNFKALAEGRRVWWKELTRTATSLFPGGGQLRKSVEGGADFAQGAAYTPTGRLRYAIEQSPQNLIRGVLFGKHAFPEAQEYYETYGAGSRTGTRARRRRR